MLNKFDETRALEALAQKLEGEGHLFEKLRDGYYLVSFKEGKYGFFTKDGWLQEDMSFGTSECIFDSVSECEVGNDITIEFIKGHNLFSLKIEEQGIQAVNFGDIRVGDMVGALLAEVSGRLH